MSHSCSATCCRRRVAGQQSLGVNLTPLPKPRNSSSLVTGGIYRYCRHPMYGGLLMASAGLSVALGDELRMLATLLVFLVLDRKVGVEGACRAVRGDQGNGGGTLGACGRVCARV